MFVRGDSGLSNGSGTDDLFGASPVSAGVGTSRHVNRDPTLSQPTMGAAPARHPDVVRASGGAASPDSPGSPDSSFSPAARRRRLLEQRQQQLARQRSRTQHAGIMAANSGLPRASTPLGASAKAAAADDYGAFAQPSSASPASSDRGSRPGSAAAFRALHEREWGDGSSAPGSPLSAAGGARSFSPVPSGRAAGAGWVGGGGGGGGGGETGGERHDGGGDAEGRDLQDLLNDRAAATGGDGKELNAIERELLAQGIAPAFDPVGQVEAPGPELDFADMRSFLTTPPPRGRVVQCAISRNKKGWSKMHPSYELRLDGDEGRFLMVAKKRRGNKTSNYLMSMDAGDLEKAGPSYLGKVRSNFIGTEFVVYDRGASPKDVPADADAVARRGVRQELATVTYESNIMGTRGPRKMTVLMPRVRDDGTHEAFRPRGEDDTMLARHRAGADAAEIATMHNKEPKWNEQVGAFVLNFRGRVSMASVKNFQLVGDVDDETVVLQFGRTSKNTFSMDYRWPLTAVQAMGICISSFDNKLACE